MACSVRKAAWTCCGASPKCSCSRYKQQILLASEPTWFLSSATLTTYHEENLFVNLLISTCHLVCSLHELSHVMFYPYNDALSLSAGHLLVLPAWLPFLLLPAKDTLIFFQKKKSPCASDMFCNPRVLCLLKSRQGSCSDLGLTNQHFLFSRCRWLMGMGIW